MNIYVIIPAFNEENTIKTVVDSVLKFNKNIIVIDDASSDSTPKILQKTNATTIRNKINLGYVKSLERGIKYAIKNKKADYIVTFDADNQFYISDLKKIIDIINKEKPDLVIGKRKIKNRFMEKIVALYTKNRFSISDPFCGLKGFNKKIFYNQKFILEKKYTIGTEIIFSSIIKKQINKIKEIVIGIKKRKDKSRFANSIKGNYLELKALINIIKIH